MARTPAPPQPQTIRIAPSQADAGQFWGPVVVIRVTEEDVAELLDCLLSCVEHLRRTSASGAVVARARRLIGRITAEHEHEHE